VTVGLFAAASMSSSAVPRPLVVSASVDVSVLSSWTFCCDVVCKRGGGGVELLREGGCSAGADCIELVLGCEKGDG
jgi:hypothetical protein